VGRLRDVAGLAEGSRSEVDILFRWSDRGRLGVYGQRVVVSS
jgi:hypothetical protein